MKINGLGILTEDGEFRLHQSVLESFAIYDETILFGIFYPNLERELHDDESSDEKNIEKDKIDNNTDKENIKNNNVYPIDFMLTPIPFQLWPKTARLIVKIKVSEQAKVIKKISKILRDEGISILNSFSNRSAHRYATWDAHIAFENLAFESIDFQESVLEPTENGSNKTDSTFDTEPSKKRPNETDSLSGFDDKKRFFKETEKKLKDLVEKLGEDDHLNKLLFKSEEEPYTKPIIGRVNTGLHYFYHRVVYIKKERYEEQKKTQEKYSADNNISKKEGEDIFFKQLSNKIYDFVFEPMSLKYTAGTLIPQNSIDPLVGKIVANTGNKVNNIIYLLTKYSNLFKANDPSILPAFTFIEANSHFLNFRIAVIPKYSLKNFVKLSVYYQRQELPYSSKGLLEHILSQLPKGFKLWKYHNRLFESRPSFESGKYSFFLEDIRGTSNYNLSKYIEDLEARLENLNKDKPPYLENFVFKYKAQSIDTIIQKLFSPETSQIKKYQYDIFISYSSKDEEDARVLQNILGLSGLTCFISSKSLSGGDQFSDEIRNALINSREFCLLYSPNSKDSSWVTTEWGAAWALKKRITPILLDLTKEGINKEHDRLRSLHVVRFREDELKKFAETVTNRRYWPN